jgi:carbon storage regulator CsrA
MLVLSRKTEEQIKIGETITITVLRVKGSTVKLGIAAPRDVRVVRGEISALPPNSATSASAASQAEDSLAPVVVEMMIEAEDEPLEREGGDSKSGAELRLPQRRPFARYSTPPLRLVGGTPALAK